MYIPLLFCNYNYYNIYNNYEFRYVLFFFGTLYERHVIRCAINQNPLLL